MSKRKWAYAPEKCDGNVCPGDCDQCEKADGRFPQRCIECEHFELQYHIKQTGSWECAVSPHCSFQARDKYCRKCGANIDTEPHEDGFTDAFEELKQCIRKTKAWRVVISASKALDKVMTGTQRKKKKTMNDIRESYGLPRIQQRREVEK